MPGNNPSTLERGRSGYWSPKTWERRVGEAVVTPFDRKHLSKGGGYELRMGREAFTTAAGKRIDLNATKDVEIPPGHFALLLTKERIRIPADSIGFISVKFGLKAKGLINVSGFHVDPGYNGWLTFSVFNAGPRTITVTRDTVCFLLWLAYWDEPVADEFLYPSDKVDARGTTESLDSRIVDGLKGDFCSPMALKQEFEDFKARQIRWRWVWGALLFLLGVVVTKGVDVGWDWIARPNAQAGANTGSTNTTPAPSAPSPSKNP